MRSYQIADETVVLADSTEVPGLGHLPVNAFLLRGAEPLLVDTGLPTSRTEFLDHLWSLCDPKGPTLGVADPSRPGPHRIPAADPGGGATGPADHDFPRPPSILETGYCVPSGRRSTTTPPPPV